MTSIAPSGCSTITHILEWRALHQPDQRAFTFLADGQFDESHISYGELNQRACQFAATVTQVSAPGDRVLLVLPGNLDYLAAFLGCLQAQRIAIPTNPPRPHREATSLESIAVDAEASVALTTRSTMERLADDIDNSPKLRSLCWLSIDDTPPHTADGWHESRTRPEEIAFLQYTSGSTAQPKGVIVSHANLMHNERLIAEAFGHSPGSIGVGWLPLFHDMGLIGTALQALYLGSFCVLMPPAAFVQSPARWLRAISTYRATTSPAPNFAYDLCVRRITAAQRAELDLTSWNVAITGGEPVRAETIERFTEAFAPCGFRPEAFRPCFGMAETTLLLTSSGPEGPTIRHVEAAALEQHHAITVDAGSNGARAVVGCGSPAADQEVAIVNSHTGARCAPNEVGEIWMRGPSRAGGYWNRPFETVETFHASLSGADSYLRTGDLGFFDDQLYVTGRIKDLIIVRGRNYYPHDIEATVQSANAALQEGCGVAFSILVREDERLVVVQEVKREALRELDGRRVIADIQRAITAMHQIELEAILLLRPGTLQRTSSGKVRRQASRTDFLSGALREFSVDYAAEVSLRRPLPPKEHLSDGSHVGIHQPR